MSIDAMVHIGSCSCQDCPVMRLCVCACARACVCPFSLPPLSLKPFRLPCVCALVHTGVCARASERVVLCVGTYVGTQVGEAADKGKATSMRQACDIPRPLTDLKLDDERLPLCVCVQHILACGHRARLRVPPGAVHGGRGGVRQKSVGGDDVADDE